MRLADPRPPRPPPSQRRLHLDSAALPSPRGNPAARAAGMGGICIIAFRTVPPFDEGHPGRRGCAHDSAPAGASLRRAKSDRECGALFADAAAPAFAFPSRRRKTRRQTPRQPRFEPPAGAHRGIPHGLSRPQCVFSDVLESSRRIPSAVRGAFERIIPAVSSNHAHPLSAQPPDRACPASARHAGRQHQGNRRGVRFRGRGSFLPGIPPSYRQFPGTGSRRRSAIKSRPKN